MFQVLGKAMLGIAGAYVLRAAAEASALPRLAVALAGIAYAFLWLVLAERARGAPVSAVYSCTSVLILAPMLWELTLRFQLLPAAATAGVLCGFALAAFALARKRDLAPVLRVACIATAALALALAVASHALLPFIVVLLIVAALCESLPQCDRLPEIRALLALAADLTIWIQIYIYFAPPNTREEYPLLGRAALLAPAIALFLIFAAAVSFKTVLRARKITVFETLQTTIAFLLAAVSLVDFGPSGSAVVLGVLCLVFSAACYAAVFTVFRRAAERRNSAVFSAWSAALLLSGSLLCLPTFFAIVLLGATAIAATWVGGHRAWPDLEFYGMIFLLAAASAAELPRFFLGALAGTPDGAPSPAVWLIAACAVLCYAAARPRQGEGRWPQALHLAFAALAAGAVAALLARGLTGLLALHVQPAAHHLAFIRTLTLCAAALVLVFSGSRWRRLELTRLGYVTLVLVAVKLVFEDLRHGHLAYIAASIFLVALTLIAAPRVARVRQKE